MRISDWSSDVCSSDLLLDRDLDIGWRAGIATVFRGLGLADAEGAVEDEENGEGGRRRDEAGDKTSRVVPGEKVEHRVSLSACAAKPALDRTARPYDERAAIIPLASFIARPATRKRGMRDPRHCQAHEPPPSNPPHTTEREPRQ